MDDKALATLRARAAADICRECDLETDVAERLNAQPDAANFLRQLLAGGAHRDAVRFLCHALEPREVVWWASTCVDFPETDPLSAKEAAALTATRAWLSDPTDQRRREAQTASDLCGVGRPAGCAALAVFLAEGSLGPPDLGQDVLAPPFACAKAGAGAILLTLAQKPAKAASRAEAFIDRWFELAATPPPWTPPPQADKRDAPPPDKRR